MRNLRTVFFGTPEFVVPIAEMLHQCTQLVGVVTAPDQPVGRKQLLTASPVADFAQKRQLPTLKFSKLTSEAVDLIKGLEPELIIVAAYGKIIPQAIIDLPQHGALNVHPSLLPKYRGASPIQSALLSGEDTTGLTIIKMDAKMDHGPIVYQEEYGLSDKDTLESLSNEFFCHAAEVLEKVIPEYIKGKRKPIDQNHEHATFCKMIGKQDGYFDIATPPSPDQLNRMIRAYFPWPTAWTRWNGKIVKLYPESMIQIEGKTKTTLNEFLKGYPDFPIKQLP